VLLFGPAKYENVIHEYDNNPLIYDSLKLLFIMIWNAARLFVRLKNITRGLNSPKFIQKAAFHSSPSLIHTLLYPMDV